MTISFNGGVDPEEVKFNGQDMETVIFNGVTVWEKVVGVEYTITSGTYIFGTGSVQIIERGWSSPETGTPFGSIAPIPTTDIICILAITSSSSEDYVTINATGPNRPIKIKFNGIIYILNSSSSILKEDALPLFDSLNINGNNTTLELIYP